MPTSAPTAFDLNDPATAVAWWYTLDPNFRQSFQTLMSTMTTAPSGASPAEKAKVAAANNQKSMDWLLTTGIVHEGETVSLRDISDRLSRINGEWKPTDAEHATLANFAWQFIWSQRDGLIKFDDFIPVDHTGPVDLKTLDTTKRTSGILDQLLAKMPDPMDAKYGAPGAEDWQRAQYEKDCANFAAAFLQEWMPSPVTDPVTKQTVDNPFTADLRRVPLVLAAGAPLTGAGVFQGQYASVVATVSNSERSCTLPKAIDAQPTAASTLTITPNGSGTLDIFNVEIVGKDGSGVVRSEVVETLPNGAPSASTTAYQHVFGLAISPKSDATVNLPTSIDVKAGAVSLVTGGFSISSTQLTGVAGRCTVTRAGVPSVTLMVVDGPLTVASPNYTGELVLRGKHNGANQVELLTIAGTTPVSSARQWDYVEDVWLGTASTSTTLRLASVNAKAGTYVLGKINQKQAEAQAPLFRILGAGVGIFEARFVSSTDETNQVTLLDIGYDVAHEQFTVSPAQGQVIQGTIEGVQPVKEQTQPVTNLTGSGAYLLGYLTMAKDVLAQISPNICGDVVLDMRQDTATPDASESDPSPWTGPVVASLCFSIFGFVLNVVMGISLLQMRSRDRYHYEKKRANAEDVRREYARLRGRLDEARNDLADSMRIQLNRMAQRDPSILADRRVVLRKAREIYEEYAEYTRLRDAAQREYQLVEATRGAALETITDVRGNEARMIELQDVAKSGYRDFQRLLDRYKDAIGEWSETQRERLEELDPVEV